MSRLSMVVQFGDILVSWSTENAGWNPSIARDMQDRALDMLRAVFDEAQPRGMLITDNEVTFDTGEEEYVEEGAEDGE